MNIIDISRVVGFFFFVSNIVVEGLVTVGKKDSERSDKIDGADCKSVVSILKILFILR